MTLREYVEGELGMPWDEYRALPMATQQWIADDWQAFRGISDEYDPGEITYGEALDLAYGEGGLIPLADAGDWIAEKTGVSFEAIKLLAIGVGAYLVVSLALRVAGR